MTSPSSWGPSMRRAWRRRRREWLTFIAFVAPNLLLFGLFTYWPLAHGLWLSFVEWNLISPDVEAVGWGNYARLLRDPIVWRVVGNTFVYACSVVAVAQALALALAHLLHRPMPGRGVLRTIAFSPYITTPAAAALVWVLLLDPESGPLAIAYSALGVDGPRFLASNALALWAVVMVGAWKEIAFATIFFLAGLSTLPEAVYDSARVDGASPWRTFRSITLPLLTPTIFFLVISGFLHAVKVFDLVAIMTDGGPVYPASSTFVYHLYQLAFVERRAGYASAFAVVFLLITGSVTLAQFRMSRRWVHYDER